MKCHICKRKMKHYDELNFNNSKIPGWKCSCGEVYYEPKEAQKILLLNSIKIDAN